MPYLILLVYLRIQLGVAAKAGTGCDEAHREGTKRAQGEDKVDVVEWRL